MSAAPAAPAEGDAPKKGPKKLIIIIVVAVLVLLLGGGAAAFFLMKKKAAHAEGEGGEEADTAHEVKKPEKPPRDPKHPPVFVPLDPFVVNLADKETERYAQVGISMQVDDPKVADEMKAYMPAIKDSIILVLSHKTSEELLSLDGKHKMAEEIQRAAARAMGYDVEEPEEDPPEDEPPKKKKKKKKKVEAYNPIEKVVYSSFIIQ